jgi:STE24 endopeptidase
MGRLVRPVTVAACTIAWLALAALLWKTTAPELELGGLDERDYFSSRMLERSSGYADGLRLLWLLATAATVVTLVVLVRVLPRSVRGMGIGRVGSAVIAGMVVLTTLWLVTLPFGVAALWWQYHWGLGPFDVGAWLSAQWATLLADAGFALMAIAVIVGLAARFRRRWWIPGAGVFIALAVGLVFVSGWLATSGATRLDDAELRAEVRRLEQAQGVNVPVRELEVSDWTDQANAFAAGFGPSTNVVLWDTLLDGRFSPGEVHVVVSHELAHVQHRHIPKGIAWYGLFALPVFFLIAEVTRRRGGMRDPANVPLAVLVVVVTGLSLAPFENAVSRRYEAEADWRALTTTGDPAATKRLFRGFQRTSLSEPNPPLLDYVWLETHPTVMQRIAMAEAYAEREGSP